MSKRQSPSFSFVHTHRYILRPGRLVKERIPIPLWLVSGLALRILIWTGLLLLTGVIYRPSLRWKLFFTATSAVMVTGLSMVSVSATFTCWGRSSCWFLVLILVDGIGFIAPIVLALHLPERYVSQADRLALTFAIGLQKPGQILSSLRKAVVIMFITERIGAALACRQRPLRLV